LVLLWNGHDHIRGRVTGERYRRCGLGKLGEPEPVRGRVKGETRMKPNTKFGLFLLLLSLSFVFFMLGSRFPTLRFGQVFPEQSAADRKHFADVEARLQSLEAENKRLAAELQKVKDSSPTIVYQQAPAPVETTKQERLPSPVQQPAPVRPRAKTNSGSRNVPTEHETTLNVRLPKQAPEETSDEVVHRGDTMQKVRRIFGRPESTSVILNDETWSYGYPKSVSFKNGLVYEWSNMPVEP